MDSLLRYFLSEKIPGKPKQTVDHRPADDQPVIRQPGNHLFRLGKAEKEGQIEADDQNQRQQKQDKDTGMIAKGNPPVPYNEIVKTAGASTGRA